VFRLFRIPQFTMARAAGRASSAEACLHAKSSARVADAIRPRPMFRKQR